MRYCYLTAFLLLASFPVVSRQSKDESISLPSPHDVSRITIEPRSMINWHTPKSLLEALPCLIPSDLTYLPKQPFQWGSFELKGGAVLRWMAANRNSILILTDKGERLFVLSPQCTRLQKRSANPNPVLLEISERGLGMNFRKRPLYFRLYESGRMEYEISSKIDPSGSKYVREIKEIQLSRGTVKELIGLAEQPDFRKALPNYPTLVRMRDSGIDTTIVYTHKSREKKIEIRNYNPQHPTAKSYYPASLIKLMKKVSALRPN